MFNIFKYTEKAERQYKYEHGNRIIQLGEVTITAIRKPRKTSSYYSKPDRTLSEEDIDKIPLTSINALLSRLPGVRIGIDGLAYISRFGSNCLAQLIIDDFPSPPDYLNMLDVSEIAQVDLLTSPINLSMLGKDGECGAIAIYTRQGKPGARRQKPNIASIVPLGFQKPVEFYAPKYDTSNQNPNPDLRTTIHWQPLLQ